MLPDQFNERPFGWQEERQTLAAVSPAGLLGLAALDTMADDVGQEFGLGAAKKRKRKRPTAVANLTPAPPIRPAARPRPRVQALRQQLTAARGQLTQTQAQLDKQRRQNQARQRVNAKLRAKNQALRARPLIGGAAPTPTGPGPAYSTMPVTRIDYPNIPVDASDLDFTAQDAAQDAEFLNEAAAEEEFIDAGNPDEDWSALDPNSPFFMDPAADGLDDPTEFDEAETVGGTLTDETEDMGSWLSKAFKKATGTKLSSVVAPVAGGLISAVPVVGGFAAPLVSNILSPGQPQTSPNPAPPAPTIPTAPTPRPKRTGNRSNSNTLLILALAALALGTMKGK